MTVSITLPCDMSECGRRDDAEDVAHAESHPEPRRRLAAAVQLLAEGEGMILCKWSYQPWHRHLYTLFEMLQCTFPFLERNKSSPC